MTLKNSVTTAALITALALPLTTFAQNAAAPSPAKPSTAPPAAAPVATLHTPAAAAQASRHMRDDQIRASKLIGAAVEAGVSLVDTADVYSDGESEEIVGKALEGRRDDVVLATKVHWEMGPGQNDHGNSRLWITREVENSLRRLRTDHIDLYQIHRPEEGTDIEETLGALDELVRKCVLFPDCGVRPAAGPIELCNELLAILEPQLIDAVLEAVQRK